MDIKKTVGNRLNSALALRDMKQKEQARKVLEDINNRIMEKTLSQNFFSTNTIH